jgi:tRNA dimethylallyltransferase
LFLFLILHDKLSIIHLKKTCIIVVGPTASGKTALAIFIAKYFSTEIISADSRQCYKELNIGVARPSEEELKEIKHHFIASHSIHDKITAASYEVYALSIAHALFAKKDVIVMVGGTGLYVKAFCEGMDIIPEADEELRATIIGEYEKNGLVWLQSEIKQLDPEFYAKGEIQNPQRMMRALEVVKQTGRSILSFRNAEKAKRNFDIIKIGLALPREELYERINHRVDIMMQQGLLNEVKGLLPYESLNALQTVGYKELFEFLHGSISLEKAVDEIKKNTRHYAKRQLTWFNKDEEINWFSPNQIHDILEHINKRAASLH